MRGKRGDRRSTAGGGRGGRKIERGEGEERVRRSRNTVINTCICENTLKVDDRRQTTVEMDTLW